MRHRSVSAGIVFFVQNVIHVLGDISLLDHRGADVGRYKFKCISAMNKRLEDRPCLILDGIPLLELPCWEDPGPEEEEHRVVHELCCRIQSGSNNCHFLALLDSVEERLRGIQGIKFRGEEDVVVPNDVCCRLDIQSLELRKDELDTHRRIPTKEVGIVGDLVLVPN